MKGQFSLTMTAIMMMLTACGTPATAQPTESPAIANRIDVEGLGITVNKDDGAVVVNVVNAAVPGWLAIHADDNGNPGAVIGYVPVEAGENKDVAVKVEIPGLTWKLYPVLYVDAGSTGEFEVPGADTFALNLQGQPINLPERVYGDLSWVEVQDQTLGADDTVVVSRVFSAGPGIMVIHAHDRPGRPGIGWAALQPGENIDVKVAVELQSATEMLGAMIHVDSDTLGNYDGFSVDPPASTTSGDILVVEFRATQ